MDAIQKTAMLERKMLPIDAFVPNPANPNKMSDGEFNLLCDNISQQGFTDAILVRPMEAPSEKFPVGRFQIVGGHHRWNAGKTLGFAELPAVINRDPAFDDEQAEFQLVRHNVIHGKMSPKLFLDLYQKYSAKYSDELLKDMFGFAEKAEFQKLIQQTKKALPKELQKPFADAAKDLKTIDGLSNLLNKLFTQYGATLKHNYMVFDYDGKESVWIRCKQSSLKDLYTLGGFCLQKGLSLDSVLNFLVKKAAKDQALQAELAELPPVPELAVAQPLPLEDQLNVK